MLGSDLASSAPSNMVLLGLTREQLDITDARALAAELERRSPDIVINAAGYTAVDRAESERDLAFAVNATAVGVLGTECAKHDIRVVHFSTDYVFDGTASRPYREDDPPSPINAYGASKLQGERALLSSGAAALVIRTQWLFGTHGPSFPRTMLERARRHEATRVVVDQRGRPTFTQDLSHATWELVSRGTLGLIHVANSGDASWYDVAQAIYRREGLPELLTPCSTLDFPRPASRPLYSVLDLTHAEREVGHTLPHWNDALQRFLNAATRSRDGQT